MGEFVLLRRPRRTALDATAKPRVLRVVGMKASRVVVLEGQYAPRIKENVRHKVQCQVLIEDVLLRCHKRRHHSFRTSIHTRTYHRDEGRKDGNMREWNT